MEDDDLLREYIGHRSEAAFAELVERHLPFVYATALRLAHDPHTAQDVAQAVFIQLARKAATVRGGHALPGWLYRATRYSALVVFRQEGRRRQRETIAMNLAEQNTGAEPAWTEIAPLLDEALGRLKAADQDAVLLRFFHEKSYHEIGVALGLGEEAARKRIERALESVRTYFTRRGMTTTAAFLGAAITAHAATPPPAFFSTSLSSASLTGASTSASISLLGRLLLMSTSSKIIIAAVVAALVAVISTAMPHAAGGKVNQANVPNHSVPTTQLAFPMTEPAQIALPRTPAAPANDKTVAEATPVAANDPRIKAVTTNLRKISATAMQYFMDEGVTEASYADLMSRNDTANLLKEVVPVGSEDYTGLVIHLSDTQISIIGPDGSVVTYNQ